jgi:hypothetical protein
MTKGIAAARICLLAIFFSPLIQAATLGNGDFEDWSVNPPSPWQFSPSSDIFATQETTNIHGGVSSASISWSTSANRALLQDGLAANAGETYTVRGWFFDATPDGRARIWVRFLDDLGNALGSGGSGYTSDSGDWQMLETVLPAPDGTQSMEVGLRFYDTSTWDGMSDINLNVDDVSIAAAPIPASLLLMGSGLLGIAAVRRIT